MWVYCWTQIWVFTLLPSFFLLLALNSNASTGELGYSSPDLLCKFWKNPLQPLCPVWLPDLRPYIFTRERTNGKKTNLNKKHVAFYRQEIHRLYLFQVVEWNFSTPGFKKYSSIKLNETDQTWADGSSLATYNVDHRRKLILNHLPLVASPWN